MEQTTHLAERLLAVIADSARLTNEQKDAYIESALKGDVHPDLLARWDEFLAQEEQDAVADLAQERELLDFAEEQFAAAKREAEPKVAAILQQAKTSFDETVMGYKAACVRIDTAFAKEVEGIARSGEDQEMNDIRAMLNAKKDAGAQAA